MKGTSTVSAARQASELSATARTEAAKRLARVIEDERRKIGELTFADLSSPDVIRRIEKLEQMINEYMLIADVNRDLPE